MIPMNVDPGTAKLNNVWHESIKSISDKLAENISIVIKESDFDEHD